MRLILYINLLFTFTFFQGNLIYAQKYDYDCLHSFQLSKMLTSELGDIAEFLDQEGWRFKGTRTIKNKIPNTQVSSWVSQDNELYVLQFGGVGNMVYYITYYSCSESLDQEFLKDATSSQTFSDDALVILAMQTPNSEVFSFSNAADWNARYISFNAQYLPNGLRGLHPKALIAQVSNIIEAPTPESNEVSEVELVREEVVIETSSEKRKDPQLATVEKEFALGIEVPFAVVEEVPVFPGCESASDNRACFTEKMQEHIRLHFQYPETAQKMGIQGRVQVVFTIQTDGSIGNIRLRGPDQNLETEALRIIKLLPKMTPGKQRGKPVSVPFSIPVTFRLK